VLKLAYYGGFTHQEISQMLEVPLGTVKSRMRLGLDRVRRALDPPTFARA
jgi:RNA polymerase sigma-70 factor (ECF subfamily)